jgi:hypothetical protein
MGHLDPQATFLHQIDEWFPELEAAIPEEVARRLAEVQEGREVLRDRGAVWTYLTSDHPFGTWTERILKGLRRKVAGG